MSARTGCARRRTLALRLGHQALQQRQREAGGLAGAGLGAGEQVAPGKHGGNRLGLDGGGFGVALSATAREQLGCLRPSDSNDVVMEFS